MKSPNLMLDKFKSRRIAQDYINLPHGRVWYKTMGDSKNDPLLILHGGPGYPSDYLWNLEAFADKYFVIFYDQLGCGRSSRSNDYKYQTLDYFVFELTLVIERLNLSNINLLGHSWGTVLAMEYLLGQPKDIKSVVFASPCLSIPMWIKTTARYIEELPGNSQKEKGQLYYKKHICRVSPEPAGVRASNAGFGGEVYSRMWGPNEYNVTGSLRDYDRSGRLGEIKLPILFTCGRYDEASPQDCAYYQSEVSGSELSIFEKSSHMPHLEEETTYLETVRNFLKKYE